MVAKDKASGSTGKILLLTSLLVLITPPVVFVATALGSGMSGGDTLDALLHQLSTRRQNLIVIGLLAMFPVLLLWILTLLIRRFIHLENAAAICALAGSAPIILINLLVNLGYWPDFLPERQFLGFPHGLEFVLGPLFYGPTGMAACVVTALLVLRIIDRA